MMSGRHTHVRVFSRKEIEDLVRRARARRIESQVGEIAQVTAAYLHARLQEYGRLKSTERRHEVWADIQTTTEYLRAALEYRKPRRAPRSSH